jgi:S1-C subfamily serine protease
MQRPLVIGIVVGAALVGGVAGGAVGDVLDRGDSAASTTATTAAAPAAGIGTAVAGHTEPVSVTTPQTLTAAQVYAQDAPGVVVITDTQTQAVPATPFGPSSSQQVGALGSGFVLDEQGDIVTNDHVVDGATHISVGVSGGASYPATIVGADPSTDLAVVRVHAPAGTLHALQLDADGTPEVGDPVYAIGNPFGLERTMTAGIVSATGRDIQSPNGLTIANAIQTDAPINHGNSGGPLIAADGRVVGVSSQIEGGTVDANVGIGFAVGAATVQAVAAQLIATGHATHPWLGVGLATIDATMRGEATGLPVQGVAVVQVAKGSPAAAAGLRAPTLQPGTGGAGSERATGVEAIVAIDGRPVATSEALTAAIAAHAPGDHVRLEVVRDGAHRVVDVTLGNAPAHP